MNDKLHPMNEVKKLDRAIQAATLEELQDAVSKYRYSNRHTSRITARIARLTPQSYNGPTEVSDHRFV